MRPEDKEKVILRKMKELQDKLDELEEEKNELVGTTLDKLVKQRVQEKNELFKWVYIQSCSGTCSIYMS